MLNPIVEVKHEVLILYQHLRWSSILLESYKNWQNKANVKAMNNFQKNVTVHGKCIILLSVCELNIKNIIK